MAWLQWSPLNGYTSLLWLLGSWAALRFSWKGLLIGLAGAALNQVLLRLLLPRNTRETPRAETPEVTPLETPGAPLEQEPQELEHVALGPAFDAQS